MAGTGIVSHARDGREWKLQILAGMHDDELDVVADGKRDALAGY
ncbi:MAG TPA: hypothetical protein VFJ01_02890 [Oleiagrimonas sp.]|nr:hypothetical protein [Oleiagrimonas sp.]